LARDDVMENVGHDSVNIWWWQAWVVDNAILVVDGIWRLEGNLV